jgi:hypothetical protein
MADMRGFVKRHRRCGDRALEEPSGSAGREMRQ